jgi:hypothetical protein
MDCGELPQLPTTETTHNRNAACGRQDNTETQGTMTCHTWSEKEIVIFIFTILRVVPLLLEAGNGV